MITPDQIVAILLAAGQSTRFGEDDKLLAYLNGQPLVLHAARRIVELAPTRKIAVCSAGADRVADLLAPLGFEIIFNPDPGKGLSSSLGLGIESAGESAAALICLGDMPFVSHAHLHALLDRFDADETPIVASKTGETAMPPAVFARLFFDQLRTGCGDRGAKALIASAAHIIASAAELSDIDTIEDLTPWQAVGRDAFRA